MSAKEAARTVLAAKVASDLLKERSDVAKVDAMGGMADFGAKSMTVEATDGVTLGTLSLVAGKVTVKVTDERAIREHVRRTAPTELIEMVNPAYLKKLLDGATAAGELVDVTTGEVLPGVGFVESAPYVACRPNADAKARMADLLNTSGLLALTTGVVSQ